MSHISTSTRAGASQYLAIVRKWSEIDPKVIAGLATSVTVGGILTAAQAVGVELPQWVAFAIVAVITFVASYLTKTKIPVADDAGLTAQQRAAVDSVGDAGVALSDGDFRTLAREAFEAAGYVLDTDGNIIDGPDDGPAVKRATGTTAAPSTGE